MAMDSMTTDQARRTPAGVRRARLGLLLFASILIPLALLGSWVYDTAKDTGLPLLLDLH